MIKVYLNGEKILSYSDGSITDNVDHIVINSWRGNSKYDNITYTEEIINDPSKVDPSETVPEQDITLYPLWFSAAVLLVIPISTRRKHLR